ncbi:MAG TPA: hypothetical protein VJX30_11880 [Terriglobales bacterium]|nr:hypothetical protein [Terriglobales bacterium]
MEIVTALLCILGLILWFANMFNRPRLIDVTAPGKALRSRLFALGDGELMGKTVDEIVAAVGPPNSRSAMANGQWLLQWQATGYHIALLFSVEGRVLSITHESAHFAA